MVRIFVVAGEPSGDALGGRLMAALRDIHNGSIEFSGVGGPDMAAQGLNSLFPMDELSVMGVTEILPHAPALFRRMRHTARAVTAARPNALVTIDAPGFAFGLVRRLPDRSVPRLHYVAPTVWAWRAWRVHKFRRNFDRLLALLPFEPPYFERVGLPCDFVGHPVLESGADTGDGAAFRARHGIAAGRPLLCLLPGSRRGEVERLAPVIGDALGLLKARVPDLMAATLTVPNVERLVRQAARAWPVPNLVSADARRKYDLMAAADVALAASGTVALELAMAGAPSVIIYKVAPLTGMVVRRMVKVRYVNLVNLALDRPAVPELIQQRCRPDLIADAVADLFENTERARAVTAAQREAINTLRADGARPSHAAARAVLNAALAHRGGRRQETPI